MRGTVCTRAEDRTLLTHTHDAPRHAKRQTPLFAVYLYYVVVVSLQQQIGSTASDPSTSGITSVHCDILRVRVQQTNSLFDGKL
jgi:hypothetical protein